LALLALRHSGELASSKTCARAAKYLERKLPDGTVYGAALGVLALLEQDPGAHREKIVQLVAALVAGQCDNGQWSYAYRRTAKKPAGDNSNTQIALLAVAAARVRRLAVPDEVFAKTRAFFRATQNPDGGFGYAEKQRSRSYGSMTAGGAMALALCASALGTEADPAASRALAWLAIDFDPAKNRGASRAFGKKKGKRGDNFWRHYWLWSLERACSAAQVELIGQLDWYDRGARFLLATQRKRGTWRDPEPELSGTCFALLFFSRSTRRSLTPRRDPAAPITPGAAPSRDPRAPGAGRG
ncbi:MAG: terpene cyclase/mutase family protein, partial [Planctomycetota bacterium]|nr:terpene cyclase/mutase family protein [Planctomycetota bacterium]